MSLAGKRIVLLGGTSGIGLATARAAAGQGAAVVVASSRPESVRRALPLLPEGSEGHQVDVTDEAQVRDFFGRIGSFDHLVYTSGESLALGTVDTTDIGDAKPFFDIRFWGAVTAVKYGAANIRTGGSIVLTTGTAGRRPQSGWAVAAGLTTALEGLTRALAVELAPVRVNAICAGVVRTELWDSLPESDREALFESTAKALPVGRVGEPADVAEAYLHLMRNGYSTGSVLLVDGGGVLV